MTGATRFELDVLAEGDERVDRFQVVAYRDLANDLRGVRHGDSITGYRLPKIRAVRHARPECLLPHRARRPCDHPTLTPARRRPPAVAAARAGAVESQTPSPIGPAGSIASTAPVRLRYLC